MQGVLFFLIHKVVFAVPPGIPSAIDLVTIKEDTASLKWTKPADSPTTKFDHYSVTFTAKEGSLATNEGAMTPGNPVPKSDNPQVSFANLKPGKAYKVKVVTSLDSEEGPTKTMEFATRKFCFNLHFSLPFIDALFM